MADAPIVTLTLNPALDVSSSVPVVAPSHKLRCAAPRAEPGGGGINVTRVCRRLSEDSVAVVPLGGPTGQRVAGLLDADGIDARVIPIGGATRESLSITEESTGHQYRFVMPGPTLTSGEVESCHRAAVEAAAGSRCMVVSGSFPDGATPDLIADLVAALPGVKVVVDTSGPALTAALESGAYLVKPSARELAQVVGRTLDTETDVADAAIEVHRRSRVEVVVASIGAGGAIIIDDSGSVRLRAPSVQVRSTVGAGDSMVAGLAVGLQRGMPITEAAALGVAAGTATVLTDGTGLCQPDDVERLLRSVATG
jgi:6-phosphofructokinase 2